MSKVNNQRFTFGEFDFTSIKFDHKLCNGIPPILRGLHYIKTTSEIRSAAIMILKQVFSTKVGKRLTEEHRHQEVGGRLRRPGKDAYLYCVGHYNQVSVQDILSINFLFLKDKNMYLDVSMKGLDLTKTFSTSYLLEKMLC